MVNNLKYNKIIYQNMFSTQGILFQSQGGIETILIKFGITLFFFEIKVFLNQKIK